MASTDTTRSEGLRPARRTIVKGAAWAVPAIAVAAPVHAVGASQCLQVTLGDATCKTPPDTFDVQWCFTNGCSGDDLEIEVTEMTTKNGAYSEVPTPSQFTLAPGAFMCVTAEDVEAPNMGTWQEIYFTVNGVAEMRDQQAPPFVDCITYVPDVVGMLEAEARATITEAGYVVGTVTYASSETVDEGRVISQDPSAGTAAAAGSPVDIVVSSGPATDAVQSSAKQDTAKETTTTSESTEPAPSADTAETTSQP